MVFCPYFVQLYFCEDSTSHLTNVSTVRGRLFPLGNIRFENLGIREFYEGESNN